MFRTLLFSLFLFSFAVKAETDETLVYGAAARPDGGENVFVVAQPDNLENPLGNPIEGPLSPPEVFHSIPEVEVSQSQKNSSFQPSQSMENTAPALEAKSLGQDFQNTLLEADGRVYDVQSYPIQDMDVMENPTQPETIYSPNVNAP